MCPEFSRRKGLFVSVNVLKNEYKHARFQKKAAQSIRSAPKVIRRDHLRELISQNQAEAPVKIVEVIVTLCILSVWRILVL